MVVAVVLTYPSLCINEHRPPVKSFFSITVTSNPHLCSLAAVATPPAPAPTITAVGFPERPISFLSVVIAGVQSNNCRKSQAIGRRKEARSTKHEANAISSAQAPIPGKVGFRYCSESIMISYRACDVANVLQILHTIWRCLGPVVHGYLTLFIESESETMPERILFGGRSFVESWRQG